MISNLLLRHDRDVVGPVRRHTLMASMFCLAEADAAAAWPVAAATRSPTGAPGTNVLARLPISRASCWPSLPLNSLADASRSYNDTQRR